MTVHHVISGASEFTACKRRIVNRLDPMPPGDSFTVEWSRVDCFLCLATLPAGQPPAPKSEVDHDLGRKPGEWPHDCDECVYLDTVERDERTYDLYFHPGQFPTVIARHGRGGDYFSGLAFASRDPLLAMALVLALKQGLIKFEDALRRL